MNDTDATPQVLTTVSVAASRVHPHHRVEVYCWGTCVSACQGVPHR